MHSKKTSLSAQTDSQRVCAGLAMNVWVFSVQPFLRRGKAPRQVPLGGAEEAGPGPPVLRPARQR